MKIFIGADHRGFKLKNDLIKLLREWGHTIEDVGTFRDDVSCDYPEQSLAVATRVAAARNSRGILVCMSGIGHSIAANKVPGAYAALCYNKQAAALSREHNNSNVLILGAKFVDERDIADIVQIWLDTKFEGGRHARRVRKIKEIERKSLKGSNIKNRGQ